MKQLAAILALATACASQNEPAEVKSELERDLTPDVSQVELDSLVADNNTFTAKLYGQIRTLEGNLFASPHSISTALAMTYAGTAGTSATQLATALEFNLPPAALHAGFNALDLELASRASAATSEVVPFRLRTANSLWGQDGYEIQTPFLDTLAVNYGAGVHVLDFKGDPDTSRETINAWVEDRTEDKIKELLAPGIITSQTRLVLTNAIFFGSAWATPFNTEATKDREFHLASGSISVPTLYQEANVRVGEGAGYRALELPYDGNKLSMVIVVPDDLGSFEATLDGAKLAAITGGLVDRRLTLQLPTFKFSSPIKLKATLQALGMIDPFVDGVADLSGIDGTRDLTITDVVHKGFVGVDEKGTEAAAATAVVIGNDSSPEPAAFAANRPFVFFIRDIPTGAILFIGRVIDPR